MKKRMKAAARFVVCVKNKGYEASLEIGKLYRVLPDKEAQGHGYLRIVDESGEDYAAASAVRRDCAFKISPASAGRSATKRSARFASCGAASGPRRRGACRRRG